MKSAIVMISTAHAEIELRTNTNVDMSCFDGIEGKNNPLKQDEGSVYKDDLCAEGMVPIGLHPDTAWLICENGILTEESTNEASKVQCVEKNSSKSCSTNVAGLHLRETLVYEGAPDMLFDLCEEGYMAEDPKAQVACVNGELQADACVKIENGFTRACDETYVANNVNQKMNWSDFQSIDDLCSKGLPSASLKGRGDWFRCNDERRLVDEEDNEVTLVGALCPVTLGCYTVQEKSNNKYDLQGPFDGEEAWMKIENMERIEMGRAVFCHWWKNLELPSLLKAMEENNFTPANNKTAVGRTFVHPDHVTNGESKQPTWNNYWRDMSHMESMANFLNDRLETLPREMKAYLKLKGLCHQDPSEGYYRRSLKRWFFNGKTNKCERFMYKGRGGNRNRFLSKKACYKKCKGLKKPTLSLYSA